MPSVNLACLPGFWTSVSSLEYSSKLNRLYCIETFGFMYCYQMNGSVFERSSVDFLGFSSGLALSPNEQIIYTTVAKIKSGILKFDVKNKAFIWSNFLKNNNIH